MRIGVFDSGIGGKTVAHVIQTAFENAEVIYANDSANVPYGTKPSEQILQLTRSAVLPLIKQTCDVIVIACNTATAIAIEALRSEFPTQLFIGLEPMLKPAVKMTRTKTIAVCATPATLASKRYQNTKREFEIKARIIEPECSDWAELIEANRMNQDHIRAVIDWCLSNNADVIVLACTHYHWIRQEMEELVGIETRIIEPTEAIIRRIRAILPQQ